jgi:hypothetical protein
MMSEASEYREFALCSAYVSSMDSIKRGETRLSRCEILLRNVRSMQHELGCIYEHPVYAKASIEFHRCCELIEVQFLSSLAMRWIQMPDKDSHITASHKRESFCKHYSCVRA